MPVAAMNPSKCGHLGETQRECRCAPQQVHKYRSRISGPLLDRIDIQVEVPAVRYKDLSDRTPGESSAAIRARVEAAREVQLERFGAGAGARDGHPHPNAHAHRKVFCNAQMSPRHLHAHCGLDADAERLLETAMDRLHLSARAYTRILKVARTVADLDGASMIGSAHVSEAIQYRSLDREI